MMQHQQYDGLRASTVEYLEGLPAITTSGCGSTAPAEDGNFSRSATLKWALVNPFAAAFACAAWQQNLVGRFAGCVAT